VPDLTDRGLLTDLALAGEDAGSSLVGYSTAATVTHSLGRRAIASAVAAVCLGCSRPADHASGWHGKRKKEELKVSGAGDHWKLRVDRGGDSYYKKCDSVALQMKKWRLALPFNPTLP